MKKQLKTGLILGMIFLGSSLFAQTTDLKIEKSKNETISDKTYLSLLLNVVTTNLNYGDTNSSLSNNKKSVNGLQIGATFQAGLNSNISLVSEFYFIMKGGKLKENLLEGINKTRLRFYTLELPLLVRYDLGKVYFNTGPSIAYNLSGTKQIDDISRSLSFNNSADGYRRWDAGIQMGAGYRFKVKQKPMALDVRYAYGLTNISQGKEIHNRYLNVSLYTTRLWKTNPLKKKNFN